MCVMVEYVTSAGRSVDTSGVVMRVEVDSGVKQVIWLVPAVVAVSTLTGRRCIVSVLVLSCVESGDTSTRF